MAKGYTIPVDLLIDRVGWNSPVVTHTDTSPVYGPKVTTVGEVTTPDDIQSPDVDIDTRQMPSSSVAVSQVKSPIMATTTTVDTINPSTMIE